MSRTRGGFAAVQNMPIVKTALRLKPATEARRKRTVPVRGHAGSYVIDLALDDGATQQQAYQHLAAPLVDCLVHGENAVLLAYGASGSGKSYTMQGSCSSHDAGIILLAVQAVLRGLSIVAKQKYRFSATHCGLSTGHDAQLLDLLAPNPSAVVASLRDGSAASAIASLTSWTVEDSADILEVLRCRRMNVSAAAGKNSNGLHTMLTLQLDSFAADRTLLSSNQLTFVELAAPDPKDPLGIGRNSNDNANARSLAMAYSSLSKVLQALRHSAPTAAQGVPSAAAAVAANGLGQQQHVPWRDSPLTRWLQERLHAAGAITLLGTISAFTEGVADSLATISWVSRFSSASKSGAGGLLVTFSWDVVADSDSAAGSYIRFHPGKDVIGSTGSSLLLGPLQQHRNNPQRATANAAAQDSFFGPACSSPMVNQCSPNLASHDSVRSPSSVHLRPHSASSVFNAFKQPRGWQLLQQSPDSMPVMQHVQQWQQQQQELLQKYHDHEASRKQHLSIPAAPGLQGTVAAATAEQVPLSPGAIATQDQEHNKSPDSGQKLPDEVLLYGELLGVLRKAGGGLRAEAILEQLLQELGAARAGLSAERGESRILRSTLAALQEEHRQCEKTKHLAQDQLQEAQHELDMTQRKLTEATADRDLFLRRLQQLESDDPSAARPFSRLELQRQKAHIDQVHLMESELHALAASNQQLRAQLDTTVQQLSRAAAEKLAAQEATVDITERLQQELHVLRSAADIGGDIRKELEASVAQLRRACEASTKEVAVLSQDKAILHQQYEEAQLSIDALAAELQDTSAKAKNAEKLSLNLNQQLQDARQDCSTAQQQVSALQAQVAALEEMTKQLQQQQQQQAADDNSMHGQKVCLLNSVIQDVHQLLEDFNDDVESIVPIQWKHTLTRPGSPSTGSVAAATLQCNSKRVDRLRGSGKSMAASAATACHPVHPALPSDMAQRLAAVVGVLQQAIQERSQTAEQLQGSLKKTDLLESNVEELRKLVSTQEDLQMQLANQLAACHSKADEAAAAHKAEQDQLQQQLGEAQAAVAALAEELQSCQSVLATSQQAISEREQALDALADEIVELNVGQEQLEANRQQAEEQITALAAELEETLLQLSLRDQLLDQVWSQLKGLSPHTAAEAAKDGAAAIADRDNWLAGGAAVIEQPIRSASFDKLKQQQQQRQAASVRLLQRRGGILDNKDGGSTAAHLAQQAMQAARRRCSQCSDQGVEQGSCEEQDAGRQQIGVAGSCTRRHSTQHAYAPSTSDTRKQQHFQTHGLHQIGGSQRCSDGSTGRHQHHQAQPLVVNAVQQLRNEVLVLQQRLAEADSGSRDSDAVTARLRQRVRELHNQVEQLLDGNEQMRNDMLQWQSKCRQLNAKLQEKDLELVEAQDHCQQLLASLKQVQQRLQQQQQQKQEQEPTTPAAPNTPSLTQQQLELQLVDYQQQAAEAKAALAETTAALAAERAARIAAEDTEAARQQLLERIAALQANLADVHGQLLAEKKAVAALKEELSLTSTSRDTWRDATKRAETAAAEALAAAEAKTTELTRARAELLSVRDQLATATRAVDAQQLQVLLAQEKEAGSGLLSAVAASEGIAARFAAAQVMRREAEDRAAAFANKLAAAEVQLAKYQQQQGEEDEAACEFGGRLSVAAAQLARSKADAAAHRAAAQGTTLRVAELGAKLQQALEELAAAKAERDALQAQLAVFHSSSHGAEVRSDQTSINSITAQAAASAPRAQSKFEQPKQQQQLAAQKQKCALTPFSQSPAVAHTNADSLRAMQQSQFDTPGYFNVLDGTAAAITYGSLVAPVYGGSSSDSGLVGSLQGRAWPLAEQQQ